MHLLTITRAYLGLSQTALAKAAGITQADLSEMENKEPYGQISKYRRLSDYLAIPVDTILRNDYRTFPESFFAKHPAPQYLPAPKSPEQLLGRQGEEFILRRERERVGKNYPALAKLILPYFKMRDISPGYDILTFDDKAEPYYLEVKTSLHDSGGFRLTNHELDVAGKLTAADEQYVICYISKWGTSEQIEQDITFSELQKSHRILPCYYFCKPTPKPKAEKISGLAYYRRLRGLRQADVSQALGIPQCDWSLYETGQRKPSVGIYLKAGELLDTTVDQLLEKYEVTAAETEAING
jgi:transcriptional regulator with XRE-family HTH domain